MRADEMMLMLRELVSKSHEAGLTLTEVEECLRRQWVAAELERQGNNQCAVAQSIGVHRNTVSRYMKQLGIPAPPRLGVRPRKHAA